MQDPRSRVICGEANGDIVTRKSSIDDITPDLSKRSGIPSFSQFTNTTEEHTGFS